MRVAGRVLCLLISYQQKAKNDSASALIATPLASMTLDESKGMMMTISVRLTGKFCAFVMLMLNDKSVFMETTPGPPRDTTAEASGVACFYKPRFEGSDVISITLSH